jgi:hypothetical protein
LKFDEFWNTLVKNLPEYRTFTSLSQTSEFQAKYSGGLIHVKTSDSIWTIKRSEMQDVWNKSLTIEPQIRFRAISYGHDHVRTLSHILALMKSFVEQNKIE